MTAEPSPEVPAPVPGRPPVPGASKPRPMWKVPAGAALAAGVLALALWRGPARPPAPAAPAPAPVAAVEAGAPPPAPAKAKAPGAAEARGESPAPVGIPDGDEGAAGSVAADLGGDLVALDDARPLLAQGKAAPAQAWTSWREVELTPCEKDCGEAPPAGLDVPWQLVYEGRDGVDHVYKLRNGLPWRARGVLSNGDNQTWDVDVPAGGSAVLRSGTRLSSLRGQAWAWVVPEETYRARRSS